MLDAANGGKHMAPNHIGAINKHYDNCFASIELHNKVNLSFTHFNTVSSSE